jgi:hypothetical protein
MNPQTFQNISKIIERESKTTTYKFALLRGVIDIIQDNSPYIRFSEGRVHFLTGLLVEKWILYYYPILESDLVIPQIGSNTQLVFTKEFMRIINYYRHKGKGGFSAFYNDLKSKGFPVEVQVDFKALIKKLRATIIDKPMRHIGSSINNNEYSIFKIGNGASFGRTSVVDLEYLLSSCGSFSIPVEYFDAFKLLGSFIGGNDSILFKWAEFSSNVSKGDVKVEKAIHEILRSPITTRDVDESKKIYSQILQKEGEVRCVWSNLPIQKFDVDHVIPFTVWKNNDLWNLLPAKATINNGKRDKIPTPEQLTKSKELIFHYWDLMNLNQSLRFNREIKVTLLGSNQDKNWQQSALTQLQSSCHFLITQRGFEPWEL